MSTKNITFTTFMFGTSIGMKPERIGDLICKLGAFYEGYYSTGDKLNYMREFRKFIQEGDFDNLDLVLIGGYLGLIHNEVMER